jgi:hypothetical protein
MLFPGTSMRPDPKEMPNVELHALDSGPFALEDKCTETAGPAQRDHFPIVETC